jgi:hypothetical protein
LPPSEKWVYEEEARKAKGQDKHCLESKFTSIGKSYAEIEREKKEAYERHARMTEEIEDTVRLVKYTTCEFNLLLLWYARSSGRTY